MQNAKKRNAVTVPVPELRDRLERARAALGAAQRATQTKAARVLVEELKQEIRTLEHDIG